MTEENSGCVWLIIGALALYGVNSCGEYEGRKERTPIEAHQLREENGIQSLYIETRNGEEFRLYKHLDGRFYNCKPHELENHLVEN